MQDHRQDEQSQLDDIVRRRRVSTVLQPIVRLHDSFVDGAEALTRGPVGSYFEAPIPLFAMAHRSGMTSVVDLLCAETAIDTALNADSFTGTLFVNLEPATLTPGAIDRLVTRAREADLPLDLMLEISERQVLDNPGALLASLDAARRSGWGIAIDDVGVSPQSLALLQLVRPDVVKYDQSITRGNVSRAVGSTINAVLSYAEQSNAIIVAEGIEDESHLERAHAIGATHGQGFLFGRPEPLNSASTVPRDRIAKVNLETPPATVATTPFGLVASSARRRTASKTVLLGLSHGIEQHASRMTDHPLLIASFQNASNFGAATRRRYESLAENSALVSVAAFDWHLGMPPKQTPSLRVVELDPSDPTSAEWSLVVLSPHFSAALLAVDCGGDGPDAERRFDYVLTHDRKTVATAARLMMAQVGSLPTAP